MRTEPVPGLETLLAAWLRYGTWIASVLTAAGLAIAMLHPARVDVVMAGIAVFIFLPVSRVAVMLIYFARERDYRFAGIAGVVLAVILLGLAVGRHSVSTRDRSQAHPPRPSLSQDAIRVAPAALVARP
jgi:hypothetical protein